MPGPYSASKLKREPADSRQPPYYYSVYGSENEAAETTPQKKVLVLGSGPIRIGQGIELEGVRSMVPNV